MNSSTKSDPGAADDPVDPLSDFEPVEYASELERAFVEDCVEAIEAKPFLQISPSTPVHEAVEMLNDSGASSLLVVKDERLAGIFTERDVLEKIAEQYPRLLNEPVEKFMTADPTIIYQSDPAASAAAAIAVAGHRHVPVLDLNENVQGIVSPRRVFDFIEKHF